jgi:hypothetical protein
MEASDKLEYLKTIRWHNNGISMHVTIFTNEDCDKLKGERQYQKRLELAKKCYNCQTPILPTCTANEWKPTFPVETGYHTYYDRTLGSEIERKQKILRAEIKVAKLKSDHQTVKSKQAEMDTLEEQWQAVNYVLCCKCQEILEKKSST